MNTQQLNKNRIINRILSELNIMISDLDKAKYKRCYAKPNIN